MPRVSRGPSLTGRLSDPAWRQATRLGEFVPADGSAAPEATTEVRVLCDDACLYVGFICRELKIEGLVAHVKTRDGPVWQDDCVELFLDVTNGRVSSCHWIANPAGVLWDGLHLPGTVKADHDSGA